MLSTFIRFKGRGLILELIKEDIAENCIPMEVVGLFDEEESGCDGFVNVVDAKALFEEKPSRDRAECGVMSEIEERVVNAADELARHGVTKMVLQDVLGKLQNQYPNTNFSVTTTELNEYGDDSFVYVMPTNFDKDKQAPLPVQFEIRADQYAKMLELYERLAAVRAGYSPSSIFPYLTQDASVKTAEEVTAQENLTAASVREAHRNMLPVFNRALREVLRQEGFSPNIQLQLGDYVGNKLRHDENVRANYTAGLTPQKEAIKQVHNLTDSEADEYLAKIREERRAEEALSMEAYTRQLNDYSKQTAQPSGFGVGGSGDEDQAGDER